MNRHLAEQIVCPNTRSKLILHEIVADPNGIQTGFYTNQTGDRLFPILHGIPILFDDNRLQPPYIVPFIEAVQQESKDPEQIKIIDRYLEFLSNHKPKSIWEFEDIVFWDARYKSMYEQVIGSNYTETHKGHRLFQRIPFLKKIKPSLNGNSSLLLEIGCGNCHTVRHINRYTDIDISDYQYIGTDASYYACLLSKSLIKHSKAEFIVCTGDNVPLGNHIADILVILGVMHHMPEKEKSLTHIVTLLKDNGYCLMHEALVFKSFRQLFSFPPFRQIIEKWFPKPEESEHEERIHLDNFMNEVNGMMDIIMIKKVGGMYILSLKFFSSLMNRNRIFHDIVGVSDKAVINSLGRVFPQWDSKEIYLLGKLKSNSC